MAFKRAAYGGLIRCAIPAQTTTLESIICIKVELVQFCKAVATIILGAASSLISSDLLTSSWSKKAYEISGYCSKNIKIKRLTHLFRILTAALKLRRVVRLGKLLLLASQLFTIGQGVIELFIN